MIKKDNNTTHNISLSKPWKWGLTLLVAIFILCFFSKKIIFLTADLGRHIKNGEVFLEQGFPISTNFYSYTEPEFPTINHHWGTGVLFYLVNEAFGFKGLSVLNILLNTLAALLLFIWSQKRYNFSYALLCLILTIPLITSRLEVRPESFSFFLISIYYCIVQLYRHENLSFTKALLILIPVQLLWVNLHLFFVFGPFVVGVFWLHDLINGIKPQGRTPNQQNTPLAPLSRGETKKIPEAEPRGILRKNKNSRSKKLLILLIVCCLISLINPKGIIGFLEPFMILREYGYMIAENQSVFFMQERFPGGSLYPHFESLSTATILIALLVIWKTNNKKQFIAPLLFLSFSTVLGYKMIRGIPVWGLFFIPVGTQLIQEFVRQFIAYKNFKTIQYGSIFISVIIILAGFTVKDWYYAPISKIEEANGIGLVKGVDKSGKFMQRTNIQGPIFNNYDIGGYFIYYLFPNRRAFVDNRPEAYSVSFFKDIYEPMQEKEETWLEMEKKYGFNCIYFYRHDNTPHAQPFLIRRINDPSWAPIFVDNYTIILVKRNNKNAALIKQFELPKSMFQVSS